MINFIITFIITALILFIYTFYITYKIKDSVETRTIKLMATLFAKAVNDPELFNQYAERMKDLCDDDKLH